MNEDMLRYQKLLEEDVLTGLKNRYAYTEYLRLLEEKQGIPEDLVIFSVDINELKVTNDNLGHLAGDELIQGASVCIQKVLGSYGQCYRTGGDEFIAFLYVAAEQAYGLKVKLLKEVEQWRGERVSKLSVSVGYATAKEHPDVVLGKDLIYIADEKMYEEKAQFYMQTEKAQSSRETRQSAMIQQKHREYMDIITALASDIVGLYVVDRRKREVTAYRISASDHQVRSGVPLEMGFETAMNLFINKNVHPDDRETMKQCICQEFIERELVGKPSFVVHFRTLIDGKLNYNYMKCIRNKDDESYDKLIISFCPEDAIMIRKRDQEFLRVENDRILKKKILLVMSEEEADDFQKEMEGEYLCQIVSDGSQAVDLLRENYSDIDAVFYQQNLPGFPVEVFLETVKEDIRITMVPIIIGVEDIKKVREEQMQEYDGFSSIDLVRKPYSKVVIRHRVENALKIRSLYASLGEIEIDALTGLYTKQAFLYHAGTILSERPQEDFTIVISDILNFKYFNRAYGRSKGDELLKVLARIARGIITDGITARYGADQFIAILKTTEKDIRWFVDQMHASLKQAGFGDVVLKFGIYNQVDRNLEVTSMCDRALQAMQSIKKNFDRTYARFDGPVSQQEIRTQMYEARFGRAIEKQQFVLWYQPKFNPYTGKIVGAEALVRWQTEDGKMISPGEFLPVFEKDGLISQLDEYVFRKVCEKLQDWMNKGKPLLPVSVNLSRNSMHRPDIIKRYKAIVEEYGISPEMIPIEITESAATGNLQIKPFADAFYEAGFLLHMDDFGSGNSSIVGLNLLHFDTVKLDQSLTQLIGTEEGNLILMYTVSLGKELGFHLVAEGAETKDQIEYLKDIGCESVQGYYYSKPLPVKEFEQLVEDNLRKANTDVKEFDYRYKLTRVDSMVKRAMDRMIQRMPGGFFAYRRDDEQIMSSNAYLWDMFGCDSEEDFMEYTGGTFRGVVCPEDYDEVERYIKEQIEDNEKEMDYVEYHIIRKDGQKVPVADYGHLDHQPDGDIFYVFISPR